MLFIHKNYLHERINKVFVRMVEMMLVTERLLLFGR